MTGHITNIPFQFFFDKLFLKQSFRYTHVPDLQIFLSFRISYPDIPPYSEED